MPDPAESVEVVDDADSEGAVGRFLPQLYVFFHKHRTIASIDRAILLTKCLARLQQNRRRWGALEVGRMVKAVERSAGLSDCYPRALLTAYLCMAAGLSCKVTVGILVPTTNMHSWCSTEGTIPYEPEPEHWAYRPLAVFDVAA